jgi:hypothetical protein
MSIRKAATSLLSFGSRMRFHEYSQSAAVIAWPFDH